MVEVVWIPVPIEQVQNWFMKVAETSQKTWYESHVINFVVENAERIIGHQPNRSWVELYLGSEDNYGRLRPDVIFETSKYLWIIEVKDRRYEGDLFDANVQVQQYSTRIQKGLKWWPNLEHRLRVFWAYPPSHGEMYHLSPWEEIPSKDLDFKRKIRRK